MLQTIVSEVSWAKTNCTKRIIHMYLFDFVSVSDFHESVAQLEKCSTVPKVRRKQKNRV